MAILVGLIVSFGYSGLSYHPLPLQVKEDIYSPAPVPTAAIPTLAPQLIPGSTASNPPDPNDPYAPSPPPVVVTTQPLPTITPVKTQNACCLDSNWNNTHQTLQTQVGAGMGFAGVALLLIAVAAIVIGIFTYPVGSIGGNNDDGFAQVMLAASMAFMILAITICIMIPVLNSVVSAGPCIC